MQAQTPEVSAEKGTTPAITSVAQLTQLLENVRCLHDISAELIAADVFSQLAELNQQVEADEWTHAKPTQAGAYWIRGNLLMEPALVQVKNDRGQLWCNLHMSTTEPDFRHGFCIVQLSDQFEWIGPIGCAPTARRPGAGGGQ